LPADVDHVATERAATMSATSRAASRPVGEDSLSPWWRRVGSEAIDLAIVLVVVAVVSPLVGARPHLSAQHLYLTTGQKIAAAAIFLGAGAVCVVPVMVAGKGQTLGKLVLGIRVVMFGAERTPVARLFVREVLLKLGLLVLAVFLPFPADAVAVIVLALDVLWPIWDRQHRALHDIAVGTHVVEI